MTTPLALPLPNDADLRLLELYSRWFAAMKAWDAAEDISGEFVPDKCPADIKARSDETCKALVAIEDEAEAVTNHGPIGAIVKLCIYRNQMRSRSEEEDGEAFRAIDILGAMLDLPAYEHVFQALEAA